ncbi:MAG: NAD-dependent epimerase/dehydratase family protein [Candidatus Thorarchaeota archaeon]|jgi:UDP-glucose 4-epimerase
MEKYILVTGGAGFIGSHIAARLVSLGYKVLVVDNLSNGREENVPREAEFVKADLSLEKDFSKLKKISCDSVFHLAAQSSGKLSFEDPLKDLQSNVLATYFLLEWSKKNGVKRFLFSSSTTTYGDPLYMPVDEKHPQQPKTYYAAGKVGCEAYIKLFQTMGIDSTIFRLPNVYGPCQNLKNKDQGMVSIYLSYILENRPIIVKGSLERFRDFIYVDDVVDAFLMALDHPKVSGKIYNLASGLKNRVQEILDALIAAFGYKEYPIEISEGTPGDQFGIMCDPSLINRDLEWFANTSIQEGISKTVEFEKRRLINEK